MEQKITIRVPDDLYKKLKRRSVAEDQKVSSIVRDAISERVDTGPVIEKYTYERRSDKNLREVVWQIGITEEGEEYPIGPFFQDDIYDLLESLPEVLNTEEMAHATDLFLEALKKSGELASESEEKLEEARKLRKSLGKVLERSKAH